jgi:hypothetical protein
MVEANKLTPAEPLVRITIGEQVLLARAELQTAPVSCKSFLESLPLSRSLLHARWSGQCGWAPLGSISYRLAPENATRYPRPGEILIYAGDLSEAEILLPYGAAAFASKAGPLAGNHILTISEGANLLPEVGETLLWKGSLPIVFEAWREQTRFLG